MGELIVAGIILLVAVAIGGGIGFWISWRFF